MPPEKKQFFIKLLLKKDLPFAVFRLPRNNKIQIIIQAERKVQDISIEKLDEAEGFAIAEFNSFKNGKVFLIKPDWNVDAGYLAKEIVKKISDLPDTENIFTENKAVSEKTYSEMANRLIQKLQAGKLSKVVLSRMIKIEFEKNFSAEMFFNLLENSYREAFIYLFNLPGIGTWVGASPEVLLKMNENEAETVSLAGTKAIEKDDWTSKELEEQKIVSDSIAHILKNCEITNYHQNGPETIAAGNIAHLKTVFKFPASELKSKIGNLVKQLHPTPAVCGLPKEIAFNLISKTEKHERRFYTGFLGPVNQNGNTNLFVNLRCAELGKNKMNVYVGGGLTAASLAKDEWEETVRKSETLLAVAKKLQTFAP